MQICFFVMPKIVPLTGNMIFERVCLKIIYLNLMTLCVRRLGITVRVWRMRGRLRAGDGISSLWNRRKLLKFHKTAENVVLLVRVRPRFEQK